MLPLIAPAILAGALFAFTLSLDEFIITYFLIGGDNTLPIYIYTQMKYGITPEVNALATLMLLRVADPDRARVAAAGARAAASAGGDSRDVQDRSALDAPRAPLHPARELVRVARRPARARREHLPVVDKARDVDLMWKNARVRPHVAPLHGNFDDHWAGGWDEAFPGGAVSQNRYGDTLPYRPENLRRCQLQSLSFVFLQCLGPLMDPC